MGISTTFRYHTEFIDGAEREKPSPKVLHARIQMRILLELSKNGLDALPELNVLAGRDRLVPDVTVVAPGASFLDGDLTAQNALLCIEIMSPGQALSDLFDKCERLLSAGVPFCWVVWGEKKRAWLYSLDNPRETQVLVCANPPLSIALEQLFQGIE